MIRKALHKAAMPRLPPPVRRDETVHDILHAQKINDPYRWLEDPDSNETKNFVKEQNDYFYDHVSKYPYREHFRSSLTKMFNYERFGCPMKRGDAYYYFHNSGLQAQSVLYKQKTLKDKPSVFFDPNTLSEDGTVSLNTYGFSKSGKYFAYGLSASGSDWVTIYVKSTADDAKADLEPKPIDWAKFTSIQWTHDDKGFFYNRYPAPKTSNAGTETDSNKNSMIFYHQLSTDASQDRLVYSDPEHPDYNFGSEVSDDGNYFILTISESCDPTNKVYIKKINDILEGKADFMKLIDNFESEYSYLTNEGPIFYFKTSLNAPKYKIVSVDISKSDLKFVDVVPQTEDVLEFCTVFDNNKLLLVYLKDVKHVMKVYDLSPVSAQESKLQLPLPIGSIVQSISARKEDKEIFYYYSSFITPGVIYHYDLNANKGAVFREVNVEGHDSSMFEVKQHFYQSKDGTKVPLYVVHKKGVELNGQNPTLLYGYGGFNISITPSFSVTWLTFIKNFNGIVAVANIRGGGEYGEEWNKKGKLARKQNCFDDFQWPAKYLISTKYTSPNKLAINGGSNGGLLVAACANQAPELFGCAIAEVGVMDMLRFMLFTIGHAWTSDYGNPRESEEDFKVSIKYSPLHNVQKEKPYPSYLLLTGDHDDRVVPLHSHKLLATLQHAAPENPNPIMIRIETKAGHGAGKSTKQRIDEATDKFSFLAMALDAKWNDQ